MKDIKTAMPTREGVDRGESLCFIDHIGKVADLDLEPATGPIGLKLGPEQGRLAGGNPFTKLGKTQSMAQLILTQRSEGQSTSLRLHPCYSPRRVGIKVV